MTRRSSGAFSILEVLVVIALLTVLLALLFPVFARAKEAAQIQSSLGRLKQMHLAASLYQSDWGGDGTSHIGLPPQWYVFQSYLNLGEGFFKSPCGYHGIVPNKKGLGYQYAWEDHPETIQYFRLRQGESILFMDASCNPSRAVWESPPAIKLGLGVRLDGSLVRLRKRGVAIELYWWDP